MASSTSRKLYGFFLVTLTTFGVSNAGDYYIKLVTDCDFTGMGRERVISPFRFMLYNLDEDCTTDARKLEVSMMTPIGGSHVVARGHMPCRVTLEKLDKVVKVAYENILIFRGPQDKCYQAYYEYENLEDGERIVEIDHKEYDCKDFVIPPEAGVKIKEPAKPKTATGKKVGQSPQKTGSKDSKPVEAKASPSTSSKTTQPAGSKTTRPADPQKAGA